MHRNLKNIAAIRLLIRQLTCQPQFDPEEIRLECKTLIYVCFLTGIEPFQLPIANHCAGDLSESQKRDFFQQYLSLYLDSANWNRAASRIFAGGPAWSSLVHLIDEVIDALEAPPSLNRPQFAQTLH